MKSFHLAAIVAALIALAVVPDAVASQHETAPAGAVFVQTNSPAGNQVIALSRASGGTLARAGTFSTGGKGAVAAGAMSDTLASQNSLVYDGAYQLLFAVNAGSNTVSVFSVHGLDLTLEQVISSGGDFPASVAVHNDRVYVLNAGGSGRVAGFRITAGHLVSLGPATSLELANSNPPNFLLSPAQVGFSPDASKLLVTTKGSTNAIDVFPISPAGTLGAPVVNPSATPAPFAFTFSSSGRLVVGEAGTSNLTAYTLAENGTLADARSQPDGQTALCWVVRVGDVYFVANTGSSTVSSYRVGIDDRPVLLAAVAATTGAGSIDEAVSPDMRFLYVETGIAGTVDEFAVGANGTLTKIGTLALQKGIEGIATS